MPVTLAETRNNATTDLDVSVIDEFIKSSGIYDLLPFDDAVNPSGGGATLDYGYRRQITQRAAAFRPYNTEYTPDFITTAKYSVTLAPLGGSFQIDRVLRKLGPALSSAYELNIAELVKATTTKFCDAVINGDVNVDANGFDGLNKALVGSTTEVNAGVVTDWSDFDTAPRAEHKALDVIDAFLDNIVGGPTVLLANKAILARIRAAARRAGQYVQDPVPGLLGANGRPVTREYYGGLQFLDPGTQSGATTDILPISTRSVGGTSYTNLGDIYAVRFGLDGFHGVSTAGGQIISTYLPDWTAPGAVKTGEVEMGPVGVALKATKAAAVLRNVKVR